MKKAWGFSVQMLLLVLIYHIGNYIAQFFHLKIPGNVIGLLLLLLLLWLKVIKVEQIEVAASWLLKHLGFFFIPISVGLMTLGEVISKNGLSLLFILITSALIGIVSTGRITQSVMSRKEKVRVTSHDHAI
ncbi:MAG: murein hydrolase [Neobacillus sp.]|jgi:holin-like protein|nr:murein hydrolase [Neobacillus sp.]